MGFNVKFVVGPVPRDLICPLCRGVLVDPLVMYPCQHTVCSSCLKAFTPPAQLFKSCPRCRGPLFEEPVLASNQLIDRLLKLIVRCHRECGHQCELSALPTHVIDECKFGTAECRNKVRGCRKELTRKRLNAHEKECEYRLVTCEGCEAQMIYARLPLHQKRHRCVEGRLMSQRVRSAAAAMKQVREHRDTLRREVITLEGQLTRLRSSKLEARGRLKSAPSTIGTPLPASLPPSLPASFHSRPRSSRSNASSKSRSLSTISAPARVNPIFMTDTSSYDAAPVTNASTSTPTSTSASTSASSLSVPPRPFPSVDVDDDDGTTVVSTNGCLSVGQPSSVNLSYYGNQMEAMALCKRCGKMFNPDNNSERSCRWHRGPIVNLFGGTCTICGQLDFKRGCVVGYHVAAGSQEIDL